VAGCDLDPSHGGADRGVESLLEAEAGDVERDRVVLVGHVDADRADVGDRRRLHGVLTLFLPALVAGSGE
jgi:hypothetical protein